VPARSITPWLFLIAGGAMLAACLLLPAQDRCEQVRWQRDRARMMLAYEQERLDRARALEEAIDRRDPVVLRALAAAELNLVPVESPDTTQPVVLASSRPRADVLASLDPPLPRLPERRMTRSTLLRLVSDPETRIWVLAGSALCVLIGLLPPANNRG